MKLPFLGTLDTRGFFFRSKAAIVGGEAVIEILAREEDLDRGFAAHNPSFATKKPTLWHPGYFLGQLLIAPPLMSSRRVIR